MKSLKLADNIHLRKLNEVHMKVEGDTSIIFELCDHFTFEVPGAKFMPAVRNKFWDGKIRLLNTFTGVTYVGLLEEIIKFCKERDYIVSYDEEFKSNNTISKDKVNKFLSKINPTLEPKDYQLKAFKHAIDNDRAVFLSPTASGKSYIIYLLTRFYNKKTLIIVPTTSLVSQLYSDFVDYGFESESYVHKIYAGQSKTTDKPITISTWQSLYKLPKEYFENFDVVIGDEAHLFKAKSLMTIMEKMINTKYRFGFTGTLDGSLTNEITLEGLFGPVYKVTTTKELMDSKVVANLKLKILVLKYPKEDCKVAKKFDYQKEIDFIVTYVKRNKIIKNLSLSLHGNTLLLFQYVDKHGKVLYDMIKSSDPTRKVYFIHGGVEAKNREEIRKVVDNNKLNSVYTLEFEEFTLKISEKQEILLINKTKKLIDNITLDDDIDIEDCINRIKSSMLNGKIIYNK